MIVEHKITVKVQILYNFQQFLNHEYDRVEAYMARHNWSDVGGFVGSEIYKGIEIKLCDVFEKEFRDFKKLEQELQEIELLFGERIKAELKGGGGR